MASEAKFPEVLDNTMLTAFRVCPQRFFNEYCRGLRVKDAGVPVDLHFGHCLDAAVTAARKAYFMSGESRQQAEQWGRSVAAQEWEAVEKLDCPTYTNKNYWKLMQVVEHYFATWPLGEDGLVPVEAGGGIQMHLTEELPFLHSVTGKPLLYAYNPDLVARNVYDEIVVIDDKTAGKFSESWMAKWDMDTQITGYIKAAKVYCEPSEKRVVYALVRGVSPGIGKSPPNHIAVPVFRTEHQIDVWELQLQADVERMLEMFRLAEWDKTLGVGCVSYGRPCEYTPLCNSPNAEQLVEANFEQIFWNPVTRTREPA